MYESTKVGWDKVSVTVVNFEQIFIYTREMTEIDPHALTEALQFIIYPISYQYDSNPSTSRLLSTLCPCSNIRKSPPLNLRPYCKVLNSFQTSTQDTKSVDP